MERLFQLVERAAMTDTSVLVRGETGTGKELVARAIHDLSPRRDKPFRAVNCATFTPELLASELFGHVKGSFTGAIRDRQGLLQLADGGTLFLDEIAELPLDIQARMLRVLQERTFVPLGGATPVTVDVRLVAATNRSLRREVEAGRFRVDLMYRVRVVPLFLPPLRDRGGDVDVLIQHFIELFNQRGLRQIRRVAKDVTVALNAHPWPGNIRELRNVVEYAFAIGEGPVLTLDELTPELRGEAPPDEGIGAPLTVRDLERERLVDALRRSGGRKGEAAVLLEISRSTLWRKLREHGLS